MGRAFPAFRSRSRALALALLAVGVALVSGAASSQANAQRSAVKGGLFNRRPRAEPVPAVQPRSEELELPAEPQPQTEESTAARLQKEQLYEAYNMLHSLAQVRFCRLRRLAVRVAGLLIFVLIFAFGFAIACFRTSTSRSTRLQCSSSATKRAARVRLSKPSWAFSLTRSAAAPRRAGRSL